MEVLINNQIYVELNPKDKKIIPDFSYESKIMMVGSITIEKGLERGFYYSSPMNQFWELLDGTLNIKDNGFLQLKKELNKNYKNKGNDKAIIVSKFYELLKKYKITICDIFKSCYIKKGETMDSAIYVKSSKRKEAQFYPTTYFNEIKDYCNKYPDCKLVANSKFVYNQLLDNLGNEFSDKIIQVNSPSGNYRQKTKLEKLENWKAQMDFYLKELN